MNKNNVNYVSINKLHLLKNVNAIQTEVGETPIYFVCKSNCYGVGLREILEIKEVSKFFAGFCVADIDEGIQLRKWGETRPIIILNPIQVSDIRDVARYNLEYVIPSINFLMHIPEKHIKNGHIAIDCGLGRIGLRTEEEFDLARRYLGTCKENPKGIYTHFSTADKLERREEKKRFSIAIKYFSHYGMMIHSEASDYLCLTLKSKDDIFRFGAGILGMNNKVSSKLHLRSVVGLNSYIVYKKQIKMGEHIGYDGKYVCKRDGWLVNIPLGYGAGLSSNSVGHQVEIGGDFGTIASVCMNQSMIIIDNEVEMGEKVVIVGDGKRCKNRLIDLTERLHIHEDEFFCSICSTMERIIEGGEQ